MGKISDNCLFNIVNTLGFLFFSQLTRLRVERFPKLKFEGQKKKRSEVKVLKRRNVIRA